MTPMSPAPPPPAHAQIRSLNALRGLAAVLVVLSHLPEFAGVYIGPPREGHLGVMLFFTLSGFLMGLLYFGQDASWRNTAAYAVARVARIAPPYLIVVLLAFGIYTWVDPSFPYAIGTHNLMRHLLLSGNESVLWSIPPEVQFYALFAALWWAGRRAMVQRRSGALIGVLVIALAMICLRHDVPGTFVGSKLHFFLMGSLLGWMAPRLRAPARGVLLALQVGLLAALALFMAGVIGLRDDYWTDLAPALVCGLAVYAFSHDSTRIDAALSARPWQWLGDWSFSIYLLHVPVLYWLRESGWLQGWAGVAAGLAVVFAVSAAFSVWVEHPACAAARRALHALVQRCVSLLRGPRHFAADPGP